VCDLSSNCSSRCASCRLQLTADETKLIWFVTCAALRNPSVDWFLKDRSVVVPVREIAFPYLLIFLPSHNHFTNVYIFKARLKSIETPLKHYNFS